MYRRLFLLCLFVLLSGCRHLNDTSEKPVYLGGETAAFTSILVQGNINVNLHTAGNSNVKLSGDPRDLAQLKWVVEKGVLRINLNQEYPDYGQVTVDISTRYLTSFSYQGTGVVTAVNLKSNALKVVLANTGRTVLQGQIGLRDLAVKGPGFVQINGIDSKFLNVKLEGKPRVQLVGTANLSSLEMKGHGWLSLYWVKSNVLKIRAKDHVFLQLAGVTKVLDVELWNEARFNGRYLRATRGFVKTHNKSEADVAIVSRQHTLADDASNIYFYNLPEMKTDFMACNGSVLDMREWERNFMQEYTRYNN